MSIAKLLRKESPGLRELYLTSNDIGNEAIEILADSLKHNTTLVKLSLGENKFREEECRACLSSWMMYHRLKEPTIPTTL